MPVSKGVYLKRMGACNKCPHFFKPTAQCKKCGCFMKIKARLINDPVKGGPVKCPVGFW